jgi:glycerol-3-phosphate cytidylyltransferase-like family protein
VAFLKEAATFGDLHVGLGADNTVYELKGRYPINNREERRYMLEALSVVNSVFINSGSGLIDFVEELKDVKPDIFIVNEDGNTFTKEELCKDLGINYLILKRIPHGDLPTRSTTSLRQECTIPFRIDIAGGWLDQPYVGKYFPGPVLTISIEPTLEFNDRSGMSSSTRRKAIELWRTLIPTGDKEQLAKILFSYENPPGTKVIAGSQDSIGIVMPGLNKLEYSGEYWPVSISSVHDEDILVWLENHLHLVTLEPRGNGYDVLENTKIDYSSAKALADAANCCWNAILQKDLNRFGKYFTDSFEAQIAMFPNMVDEFILKAIDKYKDQACGWKLSGAGGGGYIILVSEKQIDGAIKIKIRRNDL